MKKYRCTICGYIYDEEKEKVKFSDLPEDWTCPLCGAPKYLFEEVKENEKTDEKEEVESKNEIKNKIDDEDDLRQLTNYEISLICSNLARGCEKQYLDEEMQAFYKLSKYYEEKEADLKSELSDVKELVKDDINSFKEAMKVFDEYNDRGAKRVATWASKSTVIMNTLLDNYMKKGLDYIKNNKIWVCDICGFVYIGDNPPKACPVCKVPSLKILEVK